MRVLLRFVPIGLLREERPAGFGFEFGIDGPLDEFFIDAARSPTTSFAHGDFFSSLAISSGVQLSGSFASQKLEAAHARMTHHGAMPAPASWMRFRLVRIIALHRHGTASPWGRSAP